MCPPIFRTHLPVVAAALLAAAIASAAAAPPARRAAMPRRAPAVAAPAVAPAAAKSALADLASEARDHEDEGAYGAALASLSRLRGRTAADADLELALALDAVRSGQPDTAWALLYGPRLTAALADSTDRMRYRPLGPGREKMWLDGRFDGWYWSIARARAELALRLRRWSAAVLAARAAVRARPLSGRDHLLLALAAGHAGDGETSRREAALAAELDPMLPEALYLRGLWAWRDGRHADARADFLAAIARDSTCRPPALGLVRLEVPGLAPDSLPGTFLTGARRATMLISHDGPKVEETLSSDQIPGLYGGVPEFTLPDSLRARMGLDKPLHLEVTALVGVNGRAIALEFPWLSAERNPVWVVHHIGDLACTWRFKPAVRLEHDVPMWINVEVVINP